MRGLRNVALITLFFSATGWSQKLDKSQPAYAEAARNYRLLKKDPVRQKLRHHWLNAASRFEQVASKFPKSKSAPEALYRAAELLSELSRISLVEGDLLRAASDYRQVSLFYPKATLADDAALAASHIYIDRLNQPEMGRTLLRRALIDHPKGRQVSKIRLLLAKVQKASTLPAAPSAPEPDSEEDPEELAVPSKLKRSTLTALTRRRASEFTLAEQLGLKIHRVIIDAGHGGRDGGATGKGGLKEKDVALAIAHRVKSALVTKNLEVVLTRDDDVFVPLEKRARLANRVRGDLFISIHCNSAVSKTLHGVETYTLNTASDRYSVRLAARENASSVKGMSDLQLILADLATKANTEESDRLANRIQRSLVGGLKAHYSGVADLGTKQALFYVLLGTRMPAVLVETSFISNSEEAKRLGSKAYQEDIAQAIARGVENFIGNRDRLAKID